MISLETTRLTISDHTIEDLPDIHRLLSDSRAMYYVEDLRTNSLEESLQNLSTAIEEAGLEERKKYFFRIADRTTGEYIGEIGFTVTLNTPLGKLVNMGYFILPEFWGKGITTEAAREVIKFAFQKADVFKIETGCIKHNRASEGIMKRLGMIQEAEYKMKVWHDGALRDRVEYRLLKEEWLQLQK